jgi:hypothetical protein
MPTATGKEQYSLKRARRPSDNDLSVFGAAAYRSPPSSRGTLLQQPPEFDAARAERQREITAWDSLSQIWLTSRALRELDRRNKEAFKASEGGRPPSGPSASKNSLVSLSRFARGGGPDLRELRGVKLLLLIIHGMCADRMFSVHETLPGQPLQSGLKRHNLQ